jgi:hypothetical protein
VDKILANIPQNTSAAMRKEQFIKLYEDLVCHVV